MEKHTAVVTPSPALPPEIVDKIAIGGDLADVQDLLEHHSEGLTLDAYEVIKQRLKDRKAAKKEERRVERRG
jgi:hypothetical protein